MKMQYGKKRQAVAPVLATLLMIAVAVAMSVIIFMWSQGFLSQTSSATGGQQGAQNQAAQSSISIELATFTTGTSPTIKVVIRNVGAVAVTLGSVTLTGSSTNTGFSGTVVTGSLPTTGTGAAGTVTSASITSTPTDGTWNTGTLTTPSSCTGASCSLSIIKGNAGTLTLSGTGTTKTQVSSGDVVNIKITTNVGTFAQAQFTVP